MKLEGTLDTFPLRELIEMTVYSSVTGAIAIMGSLGSGQIFFRDGQPYHASYADESGEQAVVRLFEEQNAPFAFVADVIAEEETLWHDPIDLIDRAERQAMRWLQVRTLVPSLNLVPHLVANPNQPNLHIDAHHWSVLAAVNGARDLNGIAHEIGTEPLEVCEAVASMKGNGLVVLQAPDPASQQATEGGQQNANLPKRVGLFDRLLATLPTTPASVVAAVQTTPAKAEPQRHAPAAAPEDDPILRLLRS